MGKAPRCTNSLAYSDPQYDAGTITAVVTYYVFFRLNLPLNKFRRQCYKFRRQCYKFRRQCYDELVGLQRPSVRRRDNHGGSYICVRQIEPTSEQVSQTVLQVSQTVLSFAYSVTMSWLAYSDPQCDAGTITAVVTYVFFRLNLPLNKFRRQCYTFRRQCYKFRRQCYDGVGNMSGQRTCC